MEFTQARNLPLLITTEKCSGGTYIVTGANTGLGFEAAKHLVSVGAAKVILGVRNVSAGETAKAKIEEATGKANVAAVWELDLASYSSVQSFAKRAAVELDRIDALIENAAVAGAARIRAEGHVETVTVNVLSTLLLAVLLLPKLSESAQKFSILPHLVIVTSGAGFEVSKEWNKIKDDPLLNMDDEKMDILKIYPLSKLWEIIAVRYLATLIPVSHTGVVVNLVSPGLCITDLSRNSPPEFRQKLAMMWEKMGRTAEDGSRTLLHAAVAGRESHGRYLDSCEIADNKVPSWVTDEEGIKLQKRAWNVIESELESIQPGCVKKILQE